MKKINIQIALIIILSISCIILSFIAFKRESQPYDPKYISEQIKALKQQNDSLCKNAKLLQKQNEISQNIIDSLENVKSKIVIKYVEKYKEIDNASVDIIVDEFEGVFAKYNVK